MYTMGLILKGIFNNLVLKEKQTGFKARYSKRERNSLSIFWMTEFSVLSSHQELKVPL